MILKTQHHEHNRFTCPPQEKKHFYLVQPRQGKKLYFDPQSLIRVEVIGSLIAVERTQRD